MEAAMTSANDLTQKHCAPCEGGVAALSLDQVKKLQQEVPQWQVSADGKQMGRAWRVADFAAGLQFFEEVGKLAEEENHHPDLHLTSYRNVRVDLSTHAIGGLSENDFILAAKIDALPIRLKKS
jgi:4a-hydroxytetrahydrobiopterin dehydratase